MRQICESRHPSIRHPTVGRSREVSARGAETHLTAAHTLRHFSHPRAGLLWGLPHWRSALLDPLDGQGWCQNHALRPPGGPRLHRMFAVGVQGRLLAVLGRGASSLPISPFTDPIEIL